MRNGEGDCCTKLRHSLVVFKSNAKTLACSSDEKRSVKEDLFMEPVAHFLVINYAAKQFL